MNDLISRRAAIDAARMKVEEELDKFESVSKQWLEWCMDCKHAYKRKGDDDTMWCRLRKRKCPHLTERREE